LKLPQEFCTGSSIMPQKINPDVLELIRGKSARVIGNLQALMVLVKGLPLAYNRDLQEDKPPIFDSVETVLACLELAAPMVRGAELNVSQINARLDTGYLDATTLMEYLIQKQVPQRTAHHLVGQLVGEAMRRNLPLAELPAEVFHAAHPALQGDLGEVLGVRAAIRRFVSYGSTAPQEVAEQIVYWQQRLKVQPA